jgi:hypothetical protein
MGIELVIIAIVLFLAGYMIGKKAGRAAGYNEGSAAAPLLLRQQSLEQGRCCFCQADDRRNQNIHQE